MIRLCLCRLVVLNMSDSCSFNWQLHLTQSNFTNRGQSLPAHFKLSQRNDGDEVDVVVFVHGLGWLPNEYARVLSEQLQKVQQLLLQQNSNTPQQQLELEQQLQQLLSTDTLAAACRSSCHQQGGECSCRCLGPFTARLSSRQSDQQQQLFFLVGIQHDGKLALCRPEKPNHDLLLTVQVRYGLVSGLLTRACSAVLAFLTHVSALCRMAQGACSCTLRQRRNSSSSSSSRARCLCAAALAV
jgi:hypothetical protein